MDMFFDPPEHVFSLKSREELIEISNEIRSLDKISKYIDKIKSNLNNILDYNGIQSKEELECLLDTKYSDNTGRRASP